MDPTGAYDAERASALSGVPKSTIHYWARTHLLVPSVSVEKVKLWSHADLVGLRLIYWLRRTKTRTLGPSIPPTNMRAIRAALAKLRSLPDPQTPESSLWINGAGRIYLRDTTGAPATLDGQLAIEKAINLIAPFSTAEGLTGPDLLRPRPELRIVPGKLSGSPHIVDTRLETRALYALKRDGIEESVIAKLYPFVTPKQIAEALDLESQLEKNISIAA